MSVDIGSLRHTREYLCTPYRGINFLQETKEEVSAVASLVALPLLHNVIFR